MTLRLIHLTDVHFGVENAEACEAAVAYARDLKPDLVVMSGDITQKGYRREFAAGRTWLDRFPRPQVTCPGNHDVPYYHTLGRVLYPWARFERMFGADWKAGADLPGLRVRTLNTARGLQLRLNWSKGVVDLRDLDTAVRDLENAPPGDFRLFVCHHPLIEVTGGPMTGEVKRGQDAAKRLCEGEVDLVLTGHIHSPFAVPLPYGDGKTIAAGASTLSVRLRGAAPGFNVIEIDESTVMVRAVAWKEDRFESERTWALARRNRAPTAKAA